MNNPIRSPYFEKALLLLGAVIAAFACFLYIRNRRQKSPSEQEKAFSKLQKRWSSGAEGDYAALQADWKNAYGDIHNSFDKLKEEHGLPSA